MSELVNECLAASFEDEVDAYAHDGEQYGILPPSYDGFVLGHHLLFLLALLQGLPQAVDHHLVSVG